LGTEADEFIHETVQMLKRVCHKSDLLGRSNNTGFFLGLVGADLEKSSAVAKNIDELLRNQPLYGLCQEGHRIGVAVWQLAANERDDLVFVAQ
jgi:hypothetical protein